MEKEYIIIIIFVFIFILIYFFNEKKQNSKIQNKKSIFKKNVEDIKNNKELNNIKTILFLIIVLLLNIQIYFLYKIYKELYYINLEL